MAHFTGWAAGGSSEPSQGSWAYLGPRGITPWVVAQFLGAWEARKKKRGFSDFFLELWLFIPKTRNYQSSHDMVLRNYHFTNLQKNWITYFKVKS